MVAALIIGLAATGCGRAPEMSTTAARAESRQVVIGVGADEASAVVARLYAGILAGRGTDVRLDDTSRPRQRSLADLDAGALTVVPESMGDLTDHLEPLWRLDVPRADAEATFVALSRALPIGLSVADFAESATLPDALESATQPEAVESAMPPDTADPQPNATDSQPATPPAPERAPRPNNVVPLFRTGDLDPDQILALNVIAGELTTADVEAMLETIDSGRSIEEVTGQWLSERSS